MASSKEANGLSEFEMKEEYIYLYLWTRMKISVIFCLLLVVFCSISLSDAKRYLVETVDSETSDPTPDSVETADSDLRPETLDPTQYEDLTENDGAQRRSEWFIRI